MVSTQIQSIHFKADDALQQFIDQKLNRLVRYADKILKAEVFLKLQQRGKVNEKEVLVKLKVPQQTLTASASAISFEAAADTAIQTIKRRLIAHNKQLKAKRK